MKKSQSFYKLTQLEKLLFLSGVPMKYIKKPIDPTTTLFEDTGSNLGNLNQPYKTITAQTQKEFSNYILNPELIGSDRCIVIGSNKEMESYSFAAAISLAYQKFELEKNRGMLESLKWFDMGKVDWDYVKTDNSPSLVVLHGGIGVGMDPKRLTQTLDLARMYSYGTVIVLIKTGNVFDAAINLGIEPDLVFQIGSLTHRTMGV